MRVLLTGASGFVGSHVLRHLLANTDWEIICPVTFDHKGVPERISSSVCDHPAYMARVKIVHWDLRTHADLLTRRSIGDIDVIYNVASESHVDRSIAHPVPFVANNVNLMLRVLELARLHPVRLLLHMSTDEVYGPAYGSHLHKEWEPLVPSNPYSASKAAQEAIAVSYWRTYGIPLVITNTMNIIGEMQDPEKFLPKVIRTLRGAPGDPDSIPVHVDEYGTSGSRFYLHARNLADAWLYLTRMYLDLDQPAPAWVDPDYRISPPPAYPDFRRPDRYNIVGEREVRNDELVHLVGSIMGVAPSVVRRRMAPTSFHASRPGHDLRYGLDGTKLHTLGWRPPVDFHTALARTVDWTLKHPEWLEL